MNIHKCLVINNKPNYVLIRSQTSAVKHQIVDNFLKVTRERVNKPKRNGLAENEEKELNNTM